MSAPILPYRVDLPATAVADKTKPYRNFAKREIFQAYLEEWEIAGHVVRRVSETLAIVEARA